MNKTIIRLLCLLLCAVMVCGLVPAIAFAAEEAVPVEMTASHAPKTLMAVTKDDEGDIEFTTFEDLKTLAAASYSTVTYATYVGDGELTISENLTIPANLNVEVPDTLTIASGATVTVAKDAFLTCYELNVAGSLVNNWAVDVYVSLNVTGSVTNNSELALVLSATVTGEDKITNGTGAAMYWYVWTTDDAELTEALDIAAANAGRSYVIATLDATIDLGFDLTIPANASVYVYPGSTLTVGEGINLTIAGSLYAFAPINVAGTLNNTGFLYLGYFHYTNGTFAYGTLTMLDGSTYKGDGTFGVDGGERTELSEAVTGLNLDDFDVTASEDEYGKYWELTLKNKAPRFEDVQPVDYFYDPVEWAAANGYVNGYTATTFVPKDDCTRGMTVTILWRYLGQPKSTLTECPFVDVEKTDYYYDAILWAYENGVVTGYNATEFGPDDACTRGQIVTILWRYLGKPAHSVTENPFSDFDESTYYYNAILWASENKVVNGYPDGRFGADDNCNRGDFVTILYRYYA